MRFKREESERDITMTMQNCWDFKQCGREAGGTAAESLGICPAFSDKSASGLNRGPNGGRICWAVSGTFCGGAVQGTFAEKELSCMSCDFFSQVKGQEAKGFLLLKPGQEFHRATKQG